MEEVYNSRKPEFRYEINSYGKQLPQTIKTDFLINWAKDYVKDDMKTSDVVSKIIAPDKTKPYFRKFPHDALEASPYAVFVSHPWGQSFTWLLSKLKEAKVEYVWLDIFFVAQDPLGRKVRTNFILPKFERSLSLQKNMIVVTKSFEKYCTRL